MTQPLILLGAQRSGTTALAWALSEAFAAVDGHFTVNGKLPYLLDRWCRPADLSARHLRADEILHALRRRPPGGVNVERWLSEVETALRRAAAEVACGTASDATELAARIVADSYAGFSRWGDKYNEYLLHLTSLLDAVPQARFVLLVRHPLEVAESMTGWPGDRPWRPDTAEDALAKWAAWHTEWFAVSRALPAERWLAVEYVQLCSGKATETLSRFTGLDLDQVLEGLTPRRQSSRSTTLPAAVERVWDELLAQTEL